jgi:hypothetical protein
MPVFTEVVPFSVMLVGVTLHVIVGVFGVQERFTVPVAPSLPVRMIGNTTVSPGVMIAVPPPLPPTVNVNVCGTSVVPLSATVCGLSTALSVIVKVPLLALVPVGVKVTPIVQRAPNASPGGPPSFVIAQVPPETANGPLAAKFEKKMADPFVLVFFTVTFIAALVVPCVVGGNIKLAGVTVTVVCGTSVVPFNGTFCGLFAALSAIVKVPLLGLVPVGVNVTAIVQLIPSGSGSASVEQVPPVTANGPSPVEIFENETVPPPVLVFFTVTLIGELAVFSSVAGNVKLPGVTCTAICGTSVVPLSVTLCGLLAALSVIVKVPLLGAVPVGVNVTAIVQLDPAASGEPSTEQVPPETANGPSPVEILVNVMVCDAVLVFFTVTDIGLLDVFCSVAGKFKVAGVTVTVG